MGFIIRTQTLSASIPGFSMTRYPSKDDGIHNLVQRLDRMADLPAARIITFISARSGEGTSTVARDYVHELADSSDQKALLIDAGKLDGDFYKQFDADPGVTIADTIAAGTELQAALYPIEHNAHFGRWARDGRGRSAATKLLNDNSFWKTLHDRFGTVVIDAPSLQSSPDGIALAAHADATVLVIEAELTRQPVIEHLRDTLTAAGAKIAGMVMNKRHFYIPAKVYQNM
jgi:protein-tyrosine kinase